MNNKNNLNKTDDGANFKSGYNFEFAQDENSIKVHGSAKSGKEQVFFDNKLVVEKRSFGFKSYLSFHENNHHYEIEFKVANILTGEVHCTLIKDDVHVKTLKHSLMTKYQLAGKSLFWFIVSQGFVFGVVVIFLLDHYFKIFGE